MAIAVIKPIDLQKQRHNRNLDRIAKAPSISIIRIAAIIFVPHR